MLKNILHKIAIDKNYKKALISVILLCVGYWTYLIFSAKMSLAFDAAGYEMLGRMVHEKGWLEYFKTGPNREPLYPFIIALSMKLGELLSISYQNIQKIFQVLLLFISQVLVLILLNKLRIHNAIKLLVVLYIGFSPGLVNAAFSLYSEIAVIPFACAIILVSLMSWRIIQNGAAGSVIFSAILTGTLFILAAFGKGVYQYVFMIYLVPYALLIVKWGLNKNKNLRNAVVYFIVAAVTFSSGIISYMYLNKVYNGHFQFTNRFDYALFGMAYKRTNAVTARGVLSHVASIPGRGVCRIFFEEWECRYTEHYSSDFYSAAFLPTLLKDVPDAKRHKETINLTMKLILNKPLQYVFMTLIEAPKMFFWESTQIGFVHYPSWLEKLYSTKVFRYGIRFIVSVLTVMSVVFLIMKVFRDRNEIFSADTADEELQIGFLILMVLLPFVILYSLFLFLVRYALPIAPLYLVCIAYFFDNLLFKTERPN